MIDRITEQPFCQTRVSGSTFVNADCFDFFPFIEDKSIDAIICDLPYGTTACKWDSILPFDKLWKQYERLIKDNGIIILFGSQPFTSNLIMSNPKMFKYELIWRKNTGVGFAIAKYQPLRYHENILIFSKNKTTYNPIPTERFSEASKKVCKKPVRGGGKNTHLPNDIKVVNVQYDSETKSPESVLEFKSVPNAGGHKLHPTQKPVELLEYLIKTYTNEGDVVLDNTMGSGTTNLACIKLNRKSIGIEKEKQYYDVAVRRASEYCH
jgi:site-specific DNA-methyltransferase (adenine-specific)